MRCQVCSKRQTAPLHRFRYLSGRKRQYKACDRCYDALDGRVLSIPEIVHSLFTRSPEQRGFFPALMAVA